jgi:hypothetical protein
MYSYRWWSSWFTTVIYAQRDRFDSIILEKTNIGGNAFITKKNRELSVSKKYQDLIYWIGWKVVETLVAA